MQRFLKMMLDKMFPNAVLVFMTLAILNSMGIVSSQDELEHGLATDCDSKCMKTSLLFQKFSKFVDKFHNFLDYICGDKCFDYTCKCGDTTFDSADDKYCCNQRNETCEAQGLLCKAK